jgi:hypothetical protein
MDWHAVVDATPRDYFDMDARIDEDDVYYHQKSLNLPAENLMDVIPSLHDEDESWTRNDINGIIIDLLRYIMFSSECCMLSTVFFL